MQTFLLSSFNNHPYSVDFIANMKHIADINICGNDCPPVLLFKWTNLSLLLHAFAPKAFFNIFALKRKVNYLDLSAFKNRDLKG